jgi:uncharacterized protein (TIGR00730 family)
MATIAVYCSSSERIDAQYVDLAAEVGRELARRGHTLVSGGGRLSSMGAVARGARAAGGRTIGVIPDFLHAIEVSDEDNDELVTTTTMRDRKREMDERADAFLVLAGGIGTLEELFEIWSGRTLRVHDRPVVILDPHGLFAPLLAQLELLVDEGFVRREVADTTVAWTTTIAEAFAALEHPSVTPAPAASELAEGE